jgi:DHA1 family multidrug resistance protein-like MFS transporter
VLKFIDEKNPEIWKKLVNEEKSGYMAHHGTTDPPNEKKDAESLGGLGGIRTREEKEDGGASLDRPEWNRAASSDTQVDRPQSQSEAQRTKSRYNQASGVKIDPEKGRDIHLIEYFPNDPEVRFRYSSQPPWQIC